MTKLRNKKIIPIIVLALVGTFLSPFLYYWLTPVESLVDQFPVFIGYDENKNLMFEIQEKRPVSWAKLSGISRYTVSAIRLSEDWAFYQHNGFDFNQLSIVLEESLEDGKLSRGASTISQQVVKNIFLSNSRSVFRKIKEALLTVKLERNLSKKRILEIYLNIIELGDGIVGVSRGANYYFKKPASALNARESAFLAMLLPSPRKYSASYKRGTLSKFAQKRIRDITLKLQQAKIIDLDQRANAVDSSFHWEKDKVIPAATVAPTTPEATSGAEDTHMPQ